MKRIERFRWLENVRNWFWNGREKNISQMITSSHLLKLPGFQEILSLRSCLHWVNLGFKILNFMTWGILQHPTWRWWESHYETLQRFWDTKAFRPPCATVTCSRIVSKNLLRNSVAKSRESIRMIQSILINRSHVVDWHSQGHPKNSRFEGE